MSNDDQWRWADPTGQQRLVRTDELRAALASGAIPSNAPVWRAGWSAWQVASDVPELQSSAVAAANGVLPNIPPPPAFVVAAQSQFEGKPDRSAAAPPREPPPPPRYVPAARAAPPVAPPAPVVAPKPVEKKAPAPSPKAPPAQPKAAPPPSAQPAAAPAPATPPKPAPPPAQAKAPPPLPARASQRPPPLPKSVAPPPLPLPPAPPVVTAAPEMPMEAPTTPDLDWADADASLPPDANTGVSGLAIHEKAEALAKEPTVATVMGVPALPAMASPKPQAPPAAKRITTPVNMPAPPPVTIHPKAAPSPVPEPVAPEKPRSIPPPKHPTLMLYGGAPSEAPGAESKSEPPPRPIVVPPPEPSQSTTNAVTRPPPWIDGAAEIATDIPKQPPPPRALPEAAEELSGSVLLPEHAEVLPVRPVELSSSDLHADSSISVVKPVPLSPAGAGPSVSVSKRPNATVMGLGAPQIAAPSSPDRSSDAPTLEVKKAAGPDTLPPAPPEPRAQPREREQSAARLHDLSAILQGRPKWQLAAGAGVGALVALGLIGVLVRLVAGSGSGGDKPAASVAPSATAPVASSVAVATSAAPVVTAPTASTPRFVPTCAPAGASRVIAPKALLASGVEAHATAAGLSLGFATAPKEGAVAFLDAASLATSSTLRVKSGDAIKRVQAGPGDKPSAVVDVDRKDDVLQGRRALVGTTRVDVGATDGAIVWAPGGSDKGIKLFDVGGEGAVEALRGVRLPSGGFAFAFRQGKVVASATVVGDPLAPKGTLSRLESSAAQVGSPSIAATDETVMLTWAEKTDTWRVRLAHFAPGDAPSTPATFELPAGGLGEQAISPTVAALPGGAFLLVWTEGPTSGRQVRAVVLDDHGKPSGDAFTVSEAGVNAGQGQAAVLDGGKGVVAFLAAAGGKTYEAVLTPISCSAK